MYHYTSEEGLRSILSQQVVLISDDQRGDTHYRYGPGVYLTEISPDNGKFKILLNNRDSTKLSSGFKRKTECYLKFDKKELPCVKKKKVRGKRNVWLHEKEINLHPISFSSGYTESATKKFIRGPVITEAQSGGYINVRQECAVPSTRLASSNHTLAISEFVDAFSTYDDDQEDDEPTTFISRPSQQQQQQVAQGSGLGTVVAGAAATIAVGAAVYGLFSAFRRKNNS